MTIHHGIPPDFTCSYCVLRTDMQGTSAFQPQKGWWPVSSQKHSPEFRGGWDDGGAREMKKGKQP